jgi:hypothetical protein
VTNISKSNNDSLEFMGVVEFLRDRANEEEFSLVAIIARLIWSRRNSFIYEGKFSSPISILRSAKEQLEAYRLAEKKERDCRPVSLRFAESHWTPPPADCFKINCWRPID